MCDYSRHFQRMNARRQAQTEPVLKVSPAVTGDALRLRGVNARKGFCADDDRTTLVCVPDGAQLSLSGFPLRFRRENHLGPYATFTFLDGGVHGGTDRIRCQTGAELLLTELSVDSIRAIVISLPPTIPDRPKPEQTQNERAEIDSLLSPAEELACAL